MITFSVLVMWSVCRSYLASSSLYKRPIGDFLLLSVLWLGGCFHYCYSFMRLKISLQTFFSNHHTTTNLLTSDSFSQGCKVLLLKKYFIGNIISSINRNLSFVRNYILLHDNHIPYFVNHKKGSSSLLCNREMHHQHYKWGINLCVSYMIAITIFLEYCDKL